MARNFTSKAPINTLEDSRVFISYLSKAFERCERGQSVGQSFSEFIAELGPLPIDGEQWMELREAFFEVSEGYAAPENKVVTLMSELCLWLESDFVRGRRAAEKIPVRRDGKQPPIPSPFARR